MLAVMFTFYFSEFIIFIYDINNNAEVHELIHLCYKKWIFRASDEKTETEYSLGKETKLSGYFSSFRRTMQPKFSRYVHILCYILWFLEVTTTSTITLTQRERERERDRKKERKKAK